MRARFLALIFICFFIGCGGTRSVVKKGFDFSNIKKVAVLRFTGAGGEVISNEFMKQFLSAGISVIDRTDITSVVDTKSLNVDAVVSGTVAEFNPSSKMLVFKDKGNVIISDKVYPISGTTVVPSGSAFGIEDANVYSVSASVAVSAKMLDATNGEVIWSGSNSYESLDLTSAASAVVSSLKGSLKQYWPALQ